MLIHISFFSKIVRGFLWDHQLDMIFWICVEHLENTSKQKKNALEKQKFTKFTRKELAILNFLYFMNWGKEKFLSWSGSEFSIPSILFNFEDDHSSGAGRGSEKKVVSWFFLSITWVKIQKKNIPGMLFSPMAIIKWSSIHAENPYRGW